MRVIGVNNERFKQHQASHYTNTGAYFYGKEIEENILSQLQDIDVTVVTAGATLHRPEVVGRAAVVCHDNQDTLRSYILWLKKGALFICSKQSTVNTLRDAGEMAVYIPLSVDTEYVKQFRAKKTKEVAFVGNAWGFKRKYLDSLPKETVQLKGMEREELLREMAKYKRVIAEGRCLIEAKVLGCETELPAHGSGDIVDRDVIDNREVIKYWKQALGLYEGIGG